MSFEMYSPPATSRPLATHKQVFRWRFCKKGKTVVNLCTCLVLSLMFVCRAAFANPADGVVSAGRATISTGGNRVEINQQSARAVIDWGGFDIAPGETTQFIQPDANAIALNRISTSGQASVINGNLLANGKVLVINPNGVLIGAQGHVDVAGFIATSADIANDSFMKSAGHLTFDRAGSPDAVVENDGHMTVADEGLGLLVAPTVRNKGLIGGNMARLQMGAGDVFGVDLYGDGLLQLAVSETDKPRQLRAENAGSLVANAGRILMTAARASNIVNTVINTSGVVEANNLVAKGGEILLTAAGADVQVSGRISASGKTGGGHIAVGDKKAARVSIDDTTSISADATAQGDGGSILVWSASQTDARGRLSARGGASGGNGGFIETSSNGVLDVSGLSVDTSAPQGSYGTWLLDPTIFNISASYADSLKNAASNVVLSGQDKIVFSSDVAIDTAGVSLSLSAGNGGIVMAGYSLVTNGGAIAWTTSGNISLKDASFYTNGGNLSLSAAGISANNVNINTAGSTGIAGAAGFVVKGAATNFDDIFGDANSSLTTAGTGGNISLTAQNMEGSAVCLATGGSACGGTAPAAIVLTIKADPQTKIYGSGDPTLGYTVTTGGLMQGDRFTGALARVAGEDAGRYAITQGTLGVVSVGGYQYTITFVGNDFVITPAALTLTALDQSKTYGTQKDLGTTLYTVSGLQYSDEIDHVSLASAGADATAGTGRYTIAVQDAVFSSGRASNYTFDDHTGTLNVTPASLVLKANNQTKIYGQERSLPSNAFSIAGTLYNGDSVSGVSLNSAGAGAEAPVAQYEITPSNAVGTGLDNYAVTYAKGFLIVEPAVLTVTAKDLQKTYGSSLSFSADDYTYTPLYNGDTLTDVSLSSLGATATAGVNNYAITPSGARGAGLSNYDIHYVNGSLNVLPAALTVTAKDQSKIYGETLGVDSADFFTSGTLYNGDEITGVTLKSTGVSGDAAVGDYSISPRNAVGSGLANYSLHYNDGALHVRPAFLQITALDQSKIYGQDYNLGDSAFTTTALYNADTVNAVTLTSVGAAQDALTGRYVIEAAGAQGRGLSNYDIHYTTGTLLVNPAVLTVTALNQNRAEGDAFAFPAQSYALSGDLYNGDAVKSVDLASAGADTAALAGDYTITPFNTIGTGLSNYQINYQNGVLHVIPAPPVPVIVPPVVVPPPPAQGGGGQAGAPLSVFAQSLPFITTPAGATLLGQQKTPYSLYGDGYDVPLTPAALAALSPAAGGDHKVIPSFITCANRFLQGVACAGD